MFGTVFFFPKQLNWIFWFFKTAVFSKLDFFDFSKMLFFQNSFFFFFTKQLFFQNCFFFFQNSYFRKTAVFFFFKTAIFEKQLFSKQLLTVRTAVFEYFCKSLIKEPEYAVNFIKYFECKTVRYTCAKPLIGLKL